MYVVMFVIVCGDVQLCTFRNLGPENNQSSSDCPSQVDLDSTDPKESPDLRSPNAFHRQTPMFHIVSHGENMFHMWPLGDIVSHVDHVDLCLSKIVSRLCSMFATSTTCRVCTIAAFAVFPFMPSSLLFHASRTSTTPIPISQCLIDAKLTSCLQGHGHTRASWTRFVWIGYLGEPAIS